MEIITDIPSLDRNRIIYPFVCGDRSKEHESEEFVVTHINYVATCSGSRFDHERLLETKMNILKLEHDQRDYVNGISLTEKHILENKINKLQEALVFEQEKNKILEHELNETHKRIRMLNKSSRISTRF